MCTYPFAKKALTLYLARGESRERYFDCNLMQRKVLASSHQHLMAEAPDFRVARGDAAATVSTDGETLLSIAHDSTQPRWLFHRGVIPESTEEISLQTTPDTVIGGAFLFAAGPRRQSRVVFLSPDARIEDVILDDDMAFRVLVMRDSASPSPEGFDVVYESAREGRFSDRLVAVAAELYRFETLVVVQPELEGGDGTFTERQRALFERELKRLGIRESVVSE